MPRYAPLSADTVPPMPMETAKRGNGSSSCSATPTDGLRRTTLHRTRPLYGPDVLVVDPFNRKLRLVLLDGGEVVEEVDER